MTSYASKEKSVVRAPRSINSNVNLHLASHVGHTLDPIYSRQIMDGRFVRTFEKHISVCYILPQGVELPLPTPSKCFSIAASLGSREGGRSRQIITTLPRICPHLLLLVIFALVVEFHLGGVDPEAAVFQHSFFARGSTRTN